MSKLVEVYLEVEFPTFGKCCKTCLPWGQNRQPMGKSFPNPVCKRAEICIVSSFRLVSNVASFSVAPPQTTYIAGQYQPAKYKVLFLLQNQS